MSKKGCDKAKTLSKILFSTPQISESIPFLFFLVEPSDRLSGGKKGPGENLDTEGQGSVSTVLVLFLKTCGKLTSVDIITSDLIDPQFVKEPPRALAESKQEGAVTCATYAGYFLSSGSVARLVLVLVLGVVFQVKTN